MKSENLDFIGSLIFFAGMFLLFWAIHDVYETKQAAKQADISAQENMSEPLHYAECHKHDTYGAHIGYQAYCMVPIERMKEMK